MDLFVKENYHLVAHLPNKERFKALSQLRSGKESVPTPIAEPGRRGRKRKVKGGDIDEVLGKVKGVTSKIAEYANMANAAPDVALNLVRAGRQVVDKAKGMLSNLEDRAGQAGAEMFAHAFLG